MIAKIWLWIFLVFIYITAAEDVEINTNDFLLEIDERFLSVGWEMDTFLYYESKISNPVFRKIVSALGPGTLRVGGITCDFILYTFPQEISQKSQKSSKIRNILQNWPSSEKNLTMSNFQALVNLANETNLQLVFGLNEIHGRNCHVNGTHCTGDWDTSNVEAFLTYIRDHTIGPIYGFELGNELTNSYDPHLTIQENIDDYNTLNKIISKIWTNPQTRPFIIGPSTDYCNNDTATFIEGTKDFLRAFSYHSYPGRSGADLTTQLIDINWLKENIIIQDLHAHSQVCIDTWQKIGKPMGLELWITETNSAYNSVYKVMNAYYNGFWYLASLGQYAKSGVTRHSRWALESDDMFTFVNISQQTLSVLPDYWIAVLFKRLIGNKVLEATSAFNQSLVYAFCGKTSGSVVLIVVNPSQSSVTLNLTGLTSLQREEYIFGGVLLDSYYMKLNGVELILNADGSLPEMAPVKATGPPTLNPYAYGYLVFPNGAAICK